MLNQKYRISLKTFPCVWHGVPVNDPVSQPLSIITSVWGLYSFEREISRKNKTDEVTEEGSTITDSQPDCCERYHSHNKVHFAHLK